MTQPDNNDVERATQAIRDLYYDGTCLTMHTDNDADFEMIAKAAIAALPTPNVAPQPDLIRKQFDAIGKVNIPTRKAMGLDDVAPQGGEQLDTSFVCGGKPYVGSREEHDRKMQESVRNALTAHLPTEAAKEVSNENASQFAAAIIDAFSNHEKDVPIYAAFVLAKAYLSHFDAKPEASVEGREKELELQLETERKLSAHWRKVAYDGAGVTEEQVAKYNRTPTPGELSGGEGE
jgi:uncharacterized glyoxalase superfamily protein PhnB